MIGLVSCRLAVLVRQVQDLQRTHAASRGLQSLATLLSKHCDVAASWPLPEDLALRFAAATQGKSAAAAGVRAAHLWTGDAVTMLDLRTALSQV